LTLTSSAIWVETHQGTILLMMSDRQTTNGQTDRQINDTGCVTIRYNTTEEFNVDSQAECNQLNVISFPHTKLKQKRQCVAWPW